MADIRHLGIPKPDPPDEPQDKDEIITAQQEQIALLETRLAEALSLLTDRRRLMTWTIKLLNSKRGLGFAFLGGALAVYLFAAVTPFDEQLAGLVRREFGVGQQTVSRQAPQPEVELYPVYVYRNDQTPSPSAQPGLGLAPRTGLIRPRPSPSILPSSSPSDSPEALRRHCPTTAEAALPRCPSPSPETGSI